MTRVYIDDNFLEKNKEIVLFLKSSYKIQIVNNPSDCDFAFTYTEYRETPNGYIDIRGKPLSKHNIHKILNKYHFETYVEHCEEDKDMYYEGLWIEKPIGGSCGRDISLLRDPINWRKKGYILQRYLNNPLLYRIENKYHKFDIRIYVCLKNTGFYMYPDGIIRIAQSSYSIESKEAYITNIATLKTKDISKYAKILSEQKEFDYDKILNGCYEVCKYLFVKVLEIYNPEKSDKKKRFNMYGLDIIFDTEYKPWLIECNSRPCMRATSEFENFKKNVIDGMMSYGMNIESENINQDFCITYA